MIATFALGLMLCSNLATDGRAMTFRAVDARTGAAIEGVAITYVGEVARSRLKGTVTTDRDGRAVVTWTPGGRLDSILYTARKPGSVPVRAAWSGWVADPSVPAELTIRLEPATPVGGAVTDDAGRPIAGATVRADLIRTDNEGTINTTLETSQTDDRGRWRIDEAPANLADVQARVTHPRYLATGLKLGPDREVSTVMRRGLDLSGVVVDRSGRPIAGARATVGARIIGPTPENPTATTDAEGRFTIGGCAPGPTIVTVQADGFAPQLLDARPGEPLAFRLDVGAVVRVRVVGPGGEPVAGASVAPSAWRGRQSIRNSQETDDRGLVEWRGAPADMVFYTILGPGYRAAYNVPITAGEGVQTVRLGIPLVLSGRLTDARTGRPIESFQVAQGQTTGDRAGVSWSRRSLTVRGDTYRTVFRDPGTTFRVRIEAPGYRPVESRAFRPDEGEQTLDLALGRADDSSGVILRPDGRPAAGVEVAIARPEARLVLRMGRLQPSVAVAWATTDADGLFRFSPPPVRFTLVVADEAGFAEVTPEAFAQAGGAIDLQPWGRIEGMVVVRGRPAVAARVVFVAQRIGKIGFTHSEYEARTEPDGSFRFDHIPPGVGSVARRVTTEDVRGLTQDYDGWHQAVDVVPGDIARVTIGGTGRPVVGRATVAGPAISRVDWPRSGGAILTPIGPKPGPGPAAKPLRTIYIANLDGDGRFRVDDVPSGRYVLSLANAQTEIKPGLKLDQTLAPVDVPDGPPDRAVDMGVIAVETAKP